MNVFARGSSLILPTRFNRLYKVNDIAETWAPVSNNAQIFDVPQWTRTDGQVLMTSFYCRSFAGSVFGSSPGINPFKEISNSSNRLSLSDFSFISKSVSMLFSKELYLSDVSSANAFTFGFHDVFCLPFGLYWFSLGERNVLLCLLLNSTGFCHCLSPYLFPRWTGPMLYDTLSNFARISAAFSTDFGSLFSNLSWIL